MLSHRWSLHDIEDVEGLCGKVLDTRLRRWGAVLDEQDHEDALAYLLTRSWVLSLKFDPWHEATRKRSFATFLYRRIYNYEVVNWYRVRFTDSRNKHKDPILLSLDHDADGSLSELVELVTYGEEDPADRSIDVGRILGGRDRG